MNSSIQRRWSHDVTTMPFGKHKGKQIASLNSSYLDYLVKTLKPENDHNNIIGQAKDELIQRSRLEAITEDLKKFIASHTYSRRALLHSLSITPAENKKCK